MTQTIQLKTLSPSAGGPDKDALASRMQNRRRFYSSSAVRTIEPFKYQLSHDLLRIDGFTDFKDPSCLNRDAFTKTVSTYAFLSKKAMGEGGCATLFAIEAFLVVKHNIMGDVTFDVQATKGAWLVKRISSLVATQAEVIREHTLLKATNQSLGLLPPIYLKHPNRYRKKGDIRVYSEYSYVPMTQIKGPTLTEVISNLNKTGASFSQRLSVINQLLSVYKVHIEENGILHLDLKPDNVMMEKDKLFIIDCGLSARIGNTEHISEATGSLPYCDQASYTQKCIGTHTDVYALALIISEILGAISPEQFVIDIQRDIERLIQQLQRQQSQGEMLCEALIVSQLENMTFSADLKAFVIKHLMCVFKLDDAAKDATTSSSLAEDLYGFYDFPRLGLGVKGLTSQHLNEIQVLLRAACHPDLSQRASLNDLHQAFERFSQIATITAAALPSLPSFGASGAQLYSPAFSDLNIELAAIESVTEEMSRSGSSSSSSPANSPWPIDTLSPAHYLGPSSSSRVDLSPPR